MIEMGEFCAKSFDTNNRLLYRSSIMKSAVGNRGGTIWEDVNCDQGLEV
jgi:hypothetical protein